MYDSSQAVEKEGNAEGSSGVAGWPRLGREYAGDLPWSRVHAGESAPGRRRAANVYLRSTYILSQLHSISDMSNDHH